MERIVIAGSSGLIGTRARVALRDAGFEVHRLVRSGATVPEEHLWNPLKGELDSRIIEGARAVIHLGGAGIADHRWTASYRHEIRRSRVDSTRLIAQTAASCAAKPQALLVASAVGFYGDTGDKICDETAPRGSGFLAETCGDWEEAAAAVVAAGIRTVHLRFGVVLAADGGALKKMLPVFNLGLGGRLGSGSQLMSWVAADDAVRALVYCLQREELRGPVNVTAPEPVRNAEFTRALGRALGRPAVMPVPATLLRLALGRQMADECLLASSAARPEKLLSCGFSFNLPTLEAAISALLARR